ncbi:hypothetical protein GCM10010377_49210 [Streptomyces viridiviolaceus]|nr:hypothetical protein GCM10010377_49210 [Streptomyces viridiviolaceus]
MQGLEPVVAEDVGEFAAGDVEKHCWNSELGGGTGAVGLVRRPYPHAGAGAHDRGVGESGKFWRWPAWGALGAEADRHVFRWSAFRTLLPPALRRVPPLEGRGEGEGARLVPDPFFS